MEYMIQLLLLILGAASIRAQDLTASGAQATAPVDIAVDEIRGTGTNFNLQFWQESPVSWREWGQWGACTGSCGVGVQTRRRRCWVRETEVITTFNERDITNEAESNRGQSPDPASPGSRQGSFPGGIVTGEGCFGFAAQIRGCPLTPCVGTLLQWTPWSQCSATCGAATRFRSRVCQGPGECVGETFQSEPCALGPCYAWTQWTSYSACSVTCGSGQSFRTRRCAAPDGSNAPSLSECPDPLNLGSFQSQACSLSRCYQFTQWTSWSSCSSSCGAGQITRNRRCVDSATNEDAPNISDCADPLNLGVFQAQPCNFGSCYSWTQWTSYSACSLTCGAGRSFRSRRCAASDGSNAPSLSECPDPLNLGAFQSQACNLGPCYQFTEWTSWSSCSSSCGNGQITRTRRCVDIATNVDAPTIGSCADPLNLGAFQSQPCNVGLCYTWTQWSSYSSCSATCGPGQSFRSRRCAASDGSDAPSLSECPDPSNLGAFQSQPCNLGLCYSWTQWTEYSACSATCGDGQSFRTRRCAASDGSDAPSLSECADPLNLGAFQAQPCSLGPCYQYTEWSSWTSCSATCDNGQITRTRRCVDIATNIDAPSLANCADPLNLGAFQSQLCNLGSCYSWTLWTEYSSCSATCGAGQSFRTRRCAASDGSDAPSLSECPDPLNLGAFQAQPCSLGPCYQYTQWTSWSSCSATCGDGQITRTRRCVDISTNIDAPRLANCADPSNLGAFQSQPCNLGPCYSWTQWTEYSGCSATCGDGQSFRSRRCAASDGSDAPSLSECPDPLNLGSFQAQPCSLGPCYQFTEWTSWSSCSVTCGSGQVTRTRRCIDIATNIDAPTLASCADPLNLGAFQSQPCTLTPCYSWTLWTEYSACSATCGAGQSFRTRRCAASDGSDAPSLSECPDPLNLGAFQAQPCSLGPCYQYTEWTSWSSCSATCGDGQITRTRRCVDISTNIDAPRLANCADPSNLGAFQSQPCNLGPCYSWTLWTEYSDCSATCGDGQSFRTRRCAASDGSDAPSLSECADPLNLGAFQAQPCNLGPCYSWTLWTEYSSCSATCGAGQSFRTRRCAASDGSDAPSLSECPDPLNLGAFQAQPCSLGPCYQYTEWTSWSSCSATCGDGQIARTRRCVDISTNIDAPRLTNCADPSNLGAFQSQPCNLGPCYSWTQWTEYSGCSATCGDGQSFRSRRCAASDGSDAPSLSECPDPLNLGSFQAQPCSLGPCYQFTEWTSWSSCSVTCGSGQVTRTRRCIDIATNIDAPTLASCADPLNLGAFQSQPCTLTPCYSWTLWTEYSACSATCGDGQSFRTRRCAASDGSDAPSLSECADPLNLGSFQAQRCSLGPCYGFTLWVTWSSCSVTCGNGQITRTRRCIDTDTDIDAPVATNCADALNLGLFQSESCFLQPCYSWTQWTSYAQCSATCGDGQSFRTRRCAASDGTDAPSLSECPDPLNIGAFQSQSCNLGPCYRFAEWGTWSRCNSQCGQGDMQRVRSCVTINGLPGPNSGCSNDPNDFIIRATCMKPACPGTFRPWSQWGECSLTCHAGVRVRTRACSTDRCIGRSREAQICNDIPCDDRPRGTWTAWSNWSPCTNPCGGSSTQTRVCIGGRSPTDCGRDCEEYRRTKTCTDCPRGGPFSIGSCAVLEDIRVDCGFAGISPQQCENNQCCYDDSVTTPGVPWCYRQSGDFVAPGFGNQRSLTPESPPLPDSATTEATTPAA